MKRFFRPHKWLGVTLLFIGAIAFPVTVSSQARQPTNAVLVDLATLKPTIQIDIRYATSNNFTGQPLYSQSRCLLRPQVAQRLAAVQTTLEQQGLGLKVYDCYRPLAVQKKMWSIVANPAYVADPARGSRHNRGSAVDLTLVDATGKELPMPSQFDEFSARAHVDYAGGSAAARRDRQRLQQAMKQHGFVPLATEWWHFDDPDWKQYAILDIPLERI